MKLTYEVRLACSGDEFAPCAEVIAARLMSNQAFSAALDAVLEAARRQGWAQIGEDMFCPACPACAGLREQAAGIRAARAGKYCPVSGMRRLAAMGRAVLP